MFDFSHGKKLQKVQAVLTNRINQRCLSEVRGANRGPERSAYVHALVVIPGRRKHWEFENAFPALSRDISPHGLALLHNAPLEGEFLVEIAAEQTANYVHCTVRHCSEIGYGYWQVGMQANEVIVLDPLDHRRLEKRVEEFVAEHVTY